MVSINYAFKEISCKIVYYGPGLSGKTTNLQYVHLKVPPQTKGELISLATDADRTLYFDFLPIDLGAIEGFSTKFQLYTVPGQVYYNATRKLVLRGVDGLVFVADSQKSKMDENIESWGNLMENLREYEYQLESLPTVIQYNKRDLKQVISVEDLEKALNPRGLPFYEAVAVKGIGVFDTLKCISKLVLDKTKTKSEKPKATFLVEKISKPETRITEPKSSPKEEEVLVGVGVEKQAEPIYQKEVQLLKEETKKISEKIIPDFSKAEEVTEEKVAEKEKKVLIEKEDSGPMPLREFKPLYVRKPLKEKEVEMPWWKKLYNLFKR
jgi:signal recognition particle receptor subunit beta